MDAEATREFINNMSAKDLRDELNLVKQESADNDLVNGVEEKPKHSGRAVPHIKEATFYSGGAKGADSYWAEAAAKGYVKGGTAYATTRGIQRGIPVYLFDQNSNSWKVWSNGAFIETMQPILSKNAAVIGTRELQDNGKKAIDALFTGFKSEDNITSSTTNSITSQLVSHLKASGINVLGKDAMEEFLKTHNIEGLQQARAFSESFPYHNNQKASESERREIKDLIRQKKYNKSGTDIVTLDSNGNKTQIIPLILYSFLMKEKIRKKV